MATGNDNYLDIYRNFFENFATSVNPHDQLPVKLASYKLNNDEITGGVVDWTLQYLNQKHCPSSLTAILTRIVIDEIKQTCKNQPAACGYIFDSKVYEPLKLMKSVMLKVNEVCLRYLDNSELYSLRSYPSLQKPYHAPIVSTFAIKNTRRFMEDRSVYVDDLNTVFGIQDSDGPSSYYAVFDGHGGVDAAAYSAAHLHQYLAESIYYPTNPERALRDAFVHTDASFIHKTKYEDLNGGTTVVCALYRPKQNKLYVAWVGDSLALLVNHGSILPTVIPHRPSRIDEKERIQEMGGMVSSWIGGVWRVNGTLAVSRAIGDVKFKPYVTSDPDIVAVPLTGTEDFLIVASDGLWDCVSEDQAAAFVYRHIFDNPDDTACISKNLVHLAREEGSSDNISVIVVFLRDPHLIATTPLPQNIATLHNLQVPDSPNRNGESAAKNHQRAQQQLTDNNMDLELEPTLDNSNKSTNNPFVINNSNQKETTTGLLLDHHINNDDTFNNKQNGTNEDESPSNDLFYNNDNILQQPTNGKRSTSVDDEFDDDDEDRSDDFGPETDVDVVDESSGVSALPSPHHVTISPILVAAKALSEGIVNNNPFGDDEKSQPYMMESDQDDDELSDELMMQQQHRQQEQQTTTNDFDLQQKRYDSSPFDTRNTHDNTPTPPIGAVLDNSGCVATDNVAESGDDTDDEEEWSYLRGDKNNTIENCQDNNHIITDDNNLTDEQDMSQLNPDAAEFVPVSPVRSAQLNDITPFTPQNCKNLRDEDTLIAQSPQHPTPMAQTVPSSVECFINEIRDRPGNLEDDFTTPELNKDDEMNGHRDHQSSAQTLETLLNGKNVDDIEFHPKLTSELLTKEIPDVNESLTLNVSECLSTKAVYGDDTKNFAATDFPDEVNLNIKQDPMSMSFYQDKDAEGNELSTNPFDLNAVQRIPDNLDEFIGEENKDIVNKEDIDATIEEVEAALKVKAFNFEEKEQESPMEDKFGNEFESHEFKTEEPKSPMPDNDAILQEQVLNFDEQSVPTPAVADVCILASNPLESHEDNLMADVSPLPTSPSPVPEIAITPDINDEFVESSIPDHQTIESPAVEPVTASPLPDFEIESPAPDVELTPELLSTSPIGFSDVLPRSLEVGSPDEMISKSPEIDSTAEISSKSPDVISPAEEVLAKSPDILPQSPINEQVVTSPSPIPTAEHFESEVAAETATNTFSPVPSTEKETNLEKDLLQNQIDDFERDYPILEPTATSPVPEVSVTSPVPDLSTPSPIAEPSASPVPEFSAPSPVVEPSTSPVPVLSAPSTVVEPSDSPVPSPISEPSAVSPVPELTTASPIAELLVSSPVAEPEDSVSPIPEIVNQIEHIPTHIESAFNYQTDISNFEEFERQQEEEALVCNIPTSEVCDKINVPEETSQNEVFAVSPSPTFEKQTESPIPPQNIEETNFEVHGINTFIQESLNFEISTNQQNEKIDDSEKSVDQNGLHFEITNLDSQNSFSPDELNEVKEIKSTETPPPTPALNLGEPALISTSPEPNKLVEAVEKMSENQERTSVKEVEPVATVAAAAVTAAASAAVTAAVVNKTAKSSTQPEKKSTKTTSPTKSIPAKKSLGSTTSKTSTASKPLTSASKTSSPSAKLSSPRVPLASKPAARSTLSTSTSTTKPLAIKKPLTNGEVKAKPSTTAKTTSTTFPPITVKTTTSRLGSAPTKTSPTTARPPISRPLSGVTKPSAPVAKAPLTTASKPRTSLSSPRTLMTNGVSAKPASPKTTTSVGAKTTSSIARSMTSTTSRTTKPSNVTTTSSSLSARPRIPLNKKTSPLSEKTLTQSEKQIKETTNKQLSASRTSATAIKRPTGSTLLKPKTGTTGTTNLTSSVARKTETKSPLNKTTTTKTTTSTTKPTAKKPSITRTTITKTSTSSLPPALEQNQTVTLVHEITNVSIDVTTNNDPQLLVKDQSPNNLIDTMIASQQQLINDNNTLLDNNSLILNNIVE